MPSIVLPIAASIIAGPISATVERVVDGDTVRATAQIWLDQEVSVLVRVAGVDAPEIFRPKCDAERALAREAKAFVADFVASGRITLRNIQRDKYGGRVVATVENENGEDLSSALSENGFAVEGMRGNWCSD
ncbi:MAG: thermonuclease family protein [Pseudomonadota bacterium]